MKRRIILAGTTMCVVVITALAAGPSSAGTPPGNGLASFGTVTCDGIGEAELVGPRGPKAGSGYLVIGEEAHHVLATHLEVAFTDLEGTTTVVEKSFGRKVPYEPFTCTQEFDTPDGSGVATPTLAFVPPR